MSRRFLHIFICGIEKSLAVVWPQGLVNAVFAELLLARVARICDSVGPANVEVAGIGLDPDETVVGDVSFHDFLRSLVRVDRDTRGVGPCLSGVKTLSNKCITKAAEAGTQ